MAKKTLNFGMIGYKFMGKAHSQALRRVGMHFDLDANVKMRAICGRDEAWLRDNAKTLGWEEVETDYLKLVKRKDIDCVDITATSYLHKDMAVAAAEAGKHILCEKPLATTLADARAIVAAVEKAGVKHQVGFNYRFAPAIVHIKNMIEQGRLGKIFHFRGFYLQDYIIDPDFPKVWRLDKSIAGSGSHGDLNAHVIDLARYLVGELDEVIGMSETFVKERPIVERMEGLSGKAADDAPRGEVDVDDATLFLTRFANGALGSFEATRFAQGHKNDMYFEINGEKGSIKFVFERMNEIQYFDAGVDAGVQGWSTIQVSEPIHPYWEHWWPAGHIIGYDETFVHEVYEFIQSVANDRQCAPSFYDGMKVAQILEAVDRSIANRAWVRVDSV